ncbi:MAG: Acyl CoA:acetate/3-ketoacid CoA transferase, alpha subunit [Actinobacteria bacterium]|nr:Acyl CoA:acetate/3-ketoacid CoA transferase, alpha subunit [Actinomycetota bacterium]
MSRIRKEGKVEYRFEHPDDFRAFVRDRKSRKTSDKTCTASEAVSRFVADGDYIVYDFSSLTRGPQSLIREVIRQGKKDLWIGAEFTLHESALLTGAGCVTRIDVGFLGYGNYIGQAVCDGRVKVYEWTNGGLALRILAGARGVPFLPTRDLLGSDNISVSAAKVIDDPYTGLPVCLVPALNPDVAFIHVHQADIHGDARIFGTNLFALEAAMASRRVIVSAEEIIEPEEFRKDPMRTTIPYFLVDAVVHAPFGAYPGAMPARYEIDLEHVDRLNAIRNDDQMRIYLDENIYSVADHEEFLDKRVGAAKMKELRRRATIIEGYR